MQEMSHKTRIIILIDIFLFLTCILGIYHVFLKAGLESTVHVSFDQNNNILKVFEVIDPQFRDIFVPGDTLLSIDGNQVIRKEDIEFILDRFAIGDSVKVSLLRDGQPVEQKISLPPYYIWVYLLSQIIVGSAFFLLGVFVIYKRPHLLVAKVWHWASVGAGLIIMCTWGRYTVSPFGLGHTIRIVFCIAYAFVPTLFLHISYVFPKTKYAWTNKLFYPLYALSAMLALWMSVTFVLATAGPALEWFHRFMLAFDFDRSYFSFAILFGIANIIHSFAKAKEETERRKIRWVLMGLAVGPPAFVLLWQLPQLYGFDAFVPEYIIVFVMLIVPVTFTISIVKYNLLDINWLLRRSTVYFIVVSMLIILYAVMVGLTVLFIGSFTIKASLIASVALAVLIPVFLEPVRQFVQKQIDKKFFHVSYNYRLAQRHLLNELNDCFSINAIAIMVTEKLNDLLKPEFILIHLKIKDGNRWPLITGIGQIDIQEGHIREIYKYDKTINGKIYCRANAIESEIDCDELPHTVLDKNTMACVLPVKSQNQKILGYLFCGRKKAATRFTLEDIDLLTSIGIQTGIRIEKVLLQEELILKREEAEKLEEINKAKSFFVSSVSHDLQTPLTSIKMFSELLREKKNLAPEKRDEFISIIENESERLSRLIKNILDLSQIESGVKSYNFKNVPINLMVSKVLQLMQYSLEQNGFSVKVQMAGNTLVIEADEDALMSCLVNLISNAMKYSPEIKEIEIATTQDADLAKIIISDKGIGIPKEEQNRIFETFYRSSAQQIQNIAGVGLGLTITSHKVKAHNGTITLKSAPATGSTFTLAFPLKQS